MKKMSKELEALEEAKELTHRLITSGSWDKIEEQLNIVESALKEYETIKQIKIVVADAKISKEDLKKLINQRGFISNLQPCEIKSLFDEETQKKLKALEIIKEKVMPLVSLDEGELCKGHYRVYDGELYMHTELTKEEYDLLREVLK